MGEDRIVATEENITKVAFDHITDFKFLAAYEAYSKAFDNTPGADERRRLNSLISQLHGNEISYSSFYDEINRHMGAFDRSRDFKRASIQGQRKQEYRHKEQKIDRIKRHKK